MEKIDKKLFEKRLNKVGIKKQVEAAMVCEAWNKINIDKEIQNKSKPVIFKNGILNINVTNAVIASELKIKEPLILGELNKVVGNTVRSIRIKIYS